MFLDIEQQAMNNRSVTFEKKEIRQMKTMSVLAFCSCGTYWISAGTGSNSHIELRGQ